MAEWVWVVVPAVLTALAVRVDAVLVGPYFAVSSVVYGFPGLDGKFWYRQESIKRAFARRFFYPTLLGLILALSGMRIWDTAFTGLLAAVLLLWPIVFHGLPYGVSRRDWQVPVLYVLLLALYFGLAAFGWYLIEIIESAAAGDLLRYVTEQLRDMLLTGLGTAFFLAFFRGSFVSLAEKSHNRQAMGGRYDFNGDSTFLDPPPSDLGN